MLRPALIGLLLMSAAAHAQEPSRAVVMRFSGPAAQQATNVRNQVVKSVCAGEVTCTPQQKFALKNGQPNLEAMAREDVHFAVTGRLSGPAAKRVLTLEVVDPKGAQVFREEVPLVKGAVPSDALERMTSAMAESRRPPPPPAPEPEPEPVPPEPVEPPEPVVTPEPSPSDRARAEQPLVVAEVGLAFIYRTLFYDGLQTGNLRSYETEPLLLAPRVRLELYPAQLGLPDALTGLGVEADYLSSVLLSSADENGVSYPTRLTRFDVGLRWNFRPVEETDVMVAPLLGYRGGGFSTFESDGGTRIVGLPDMGYGSLRAGGEAQAGFGPVVLALRAEYLHGLGPGEVGELFEDASQRGFAGAFGLGYRLTKNFEARLRLEFTRFGYDFEFAEGAPFRAQGANDDQLGGSLMLRFAW